MDVRAYEIFVVLAQERHFTRAADRLQMAQPVVSQSIKRLEKELKTVLFNRSTRPIQLTAEGEAVLPFAIQVLEADRMSRKVVNPDQGGVIGKVEIGYAGASVNMLLPRLVSAVRSMTLRIDLKLHPMVYAGATQALVASGELDLAFSRRPLTRPELTERIVEYERLVVALPSSHRLAGESSVSLADLEEERWVMFPASKGSALRDAGLRLAQNAGYSPNITQEGPDSYAILGMVAAGVGITITLSSVTHFRPPGVRFVEIEGEAKFLVATLVQPALPAPASRLVIDAFIREFPTPKRPSGQIYG